MKIDLVKIEAYAKTEARKAAAKAFAESEIEVSNPGRVLLVQVFESKREWYALEGRAISDPKARHAHRAKNAKAAEAAKAKTYRLLAAGGWASLDEAKMAGRALGLFDSRVKR